MTPAVVKNFNRRAFGRVFPELLARRSPDRVLTASAIKRNSLTAETSSAVVC
jgi:hypothetical protein